MTNGFDLAAAEWFYSIRSDYLTSIFRFITHLGDAWFITALCIILIVISYTSKNSFALPLVSGATISAILQKLLKYLIKRPRPDIEMFLIDQSGYSFPSGHSMTGFVFYGFAIYLIRKKFPGNRHANICSVFLGVLIFLIGVSRLYLGVHYVTDVLAGWSIGAVLLFSLIKVYGRYGSDLNNRINKNSNK